MWQEFEITVGEKFRKPGFAKSIFDSVVGLEFENETANPFDLPNIAGFQVHPEGSLRNFGFEYVLNPPKPKQDVSKSTEEFFRRINKAAGSTNPLTNSLRTSTHVHFDVTKLNYGQLMVFAMSYWLLEGLFSEFCGGTRKGNHFCLRLKDCGQISWHLAQGIRKGTPYSGIMYNNEYRYASLNLASVAKFGSLEFRMMRGLSDAQTTLAWIEMLDKCRTFANNFKTPHDFGQAFISNLSSKTLPLEILGGELYELVAKCLPPGFNIESSLQESFLACLPIISAGKTWDFSTRIEEEKKELGKFGAPPSWVSSHFVDDPADPAIVAGRQRIAAHLNTNRIIFDGFGAIENTEVFLDTSQYYVPDSTRSSLEWWTEDGSDEPLNNILNDPIA